MPGFLGTFDYSNCTAGRIPDTESHPTTTCNCRLRVKVRTISKFMSDKVYYEDDFYVVLIEGVLFNKDLLLATHSTNLLSALVVMLYREYGDTFFSVLRGSFSGLLLDKLNDKLIIFTDHIGDKAVFYSITKSQLLFGSELRYIADLMRNHNITYSLDLAAAYSILTYGYLVSDLTYITEAKRLRAGHYLVCECGHCTIAQYHAFTCSPNNSLSEANIVDRIDLLFTDAVKMQIAKNAEYGYPDYSSLSAGLESRMTTFVVSSLRQRDVITYTYSPVGYTDQITSNDIAAFLKNTRHIYQCGYTGHVLLDIDDSILSNGGLYMYYGAAVLNQYFAVLDKTNIGIIHTGQLGGVILGTYEEHGACGIVPVERDMHSRRLASTFRSLYNLDDLMREYGNRELFSIYNRGFQGILAGANLAFQQFTETASPFCDVEFCEFCLTIPLEMRRKHYIYDRWIMSKYPDAARFRHNGDRVIGGALNSVRKLRRDIVKLLCRNLGLSERLCTSVTPINAWEQNPNISAGLKRYCYEHIELLSMYPELHNDCKTMFEMGTALERNQVLTLLGVVRLLFGSHQGNDKLCDAAA